jgi:hypothetical protein
MKANASRSLIPFAILFKNNEKKTAKNIAILENYVDIEVAGVLQCRKCCRKT